MMVAAMRQAAHAIAIRHARIHSACQQRQRRRQQRYNHENSLHPSHRQKVYHSSTRLASKSQRRAAKFPQAQFAPTKTSRYASFIVLPFKLIYDHRYDLNLGEHVFPSQKYRLVYEALLQSGTADSADFLSPAPATDADVLRVHTSAYVRKLKTASLSRAELQQLEIPYSQELIEACWLAAGGSILAGQKALQHGWSANIGGGFHHACPDHGEGFCVLHDVAIAIRRLQSDQAVERAMVIDTDVHHGNGTATIFADDNDVFTLSIHQLRNYPFIKPPSTMDINLPDGVEDEDYLAILEEHLRKAFSNFSPQIIFYLAGADPYREDQLGGLALTMEGLARRDALVMDSAHKNKCPLVITLAGGYARRVQDTVAIHVGTILAARDAAEKKPQEANSLKPRSQSPPESQS
jgi:acetoin utilization deacetylase AcuC-like enzyme